MNRLHHFIEIEVDGNKTVCGRDAERQDAERQDAEDRMPKDNMPNGQNTEKRRRDPT